MKLTDFLNSYSPGKLRDPYIIAEAAETPIGKN